MLAVTIRIPSSSTVHRLGAATVCALLVVVGIWTGVTIVAHIGADLVVPAPPVLVVRAVVMA